jgi:heat shock protein HslJ
MQRVTARKFLPMRRWLLLAALAGCAEQDPPGRSGIPARTPDVATAFRAQLGRTWELERLGDQAIPDAPAGTRVQREGRHPGPGSRPTLRFTASPAPEGSVHPAGTRIAGGWSFCNGYGTAYELGAGGALRFHGFESTLVGCDGPDSLETRFFRGLADTRRVDLDSTRLALVAEDGSRLVFVIVPDSLASAAH